MTTRFNPDRQRWQYDFIRGKKRYAGYCVDEKGVPAKSKREADACEARIKKEVEKMLKAAPGYSGVVVAGAYAFGQMMADYVSHHAGRQRSWKTNMKRHVAELLEFFGRATAAASLTVDDIDRYIAFARQQKRTVYIGGAKALTDPSQHVARSGASLRTDSTTNRYLTTLRAAINFAAARGKMPALKVRRLEEPKDLPNPVSLDEVRAILAVAAPHLRLAIMIAVHTGMRLDETLGLKWADVDLRRRVIVLASAETKSKVGQVVHINDVLAEILEAEERHIDSVISYKPRGEDAEYRSVLSLRRAWAGAQARAGISPPHRFHDLRATFATAVLESGANPMTLKEAMRHASLSTTLRYAKVHDVAVKNAFSATSQFSFSQTQPTNVDGAHAKGVADTTEKE